MKETGQSGAIRTSRDPRPVTESKPVSEQRRIVALADEAAYKQVPIAHWVMLGSFRSKDEAEAEWDMLRSLHPQILDSYSPLVAAPRYSSSAEPLVRLKIGPFAEQAYAMRMCHDLQQRGTECLSVRE